MRAATADLLGAADPAEVSFGPNMTTITFALSRAIGAGLRRGDAVVVTRLDHDANVAPWLAVAAERELDVRWVDIRDDCTLALEDLERALDAGGVKLVAAGLASNAVGTINPIPAIARLVHDAGAQLLAWTRCTPRRTWPSTSPSWAPTSWSARPTSNDGPHLGVLWGRRELLEALPHYHVRPAGDAIPGRFETGTQAHELLAGWGGAITYLEDVGVTQGGAAGLIRCRRRQSRRARLLAAMSAVRR